MKPTTTIAIFFRWDIKGQIYLTAIAVVVVTEIVSASVYKNPFSK